MAYTSRVIEATNRLTAGYTKSNHLLNEDFYIEPTKCLETAQQQKGRVWKISGFFVILCLLFTCLGLFYWRTSTANAPTHKKFFQVLSSSKYARISLWVVDKDARTLITQTDIEFAQDLGNPGLCKTSDAKLCLDWINAPWQKRTASIAVRNVISDDELDCHLYDIKLDKVNEVSACLSLNESNLYGGPLRASTNYWPSEKNNFQESPLVTGLNGNDGVVEPFWVTSKGQVIYVPRDVPLFVSQTSKQLCLHSKQQSPYIFSKEKIAGLKFYLCSGKDIKSVYLQSLKKFVGVPKSIPEITAFQYPIWSTWAKYKREINESSVLDFASAILYNKFNVSYYELDDGWQNCYGQFLFNKKFPSADDMFQKLKNKKFKISIWVHPFISTLCPDFSFANENGFLVTSFNRKVNSTLWWNGIAGLIDFTNPSAVSWWTKKVDAFKRTFDLDGLKFDAGEISYFPGSPRSAPLHSALNLQPNIYTTKYIEIASAFSIFTEVRVVNRNQQLPIFLRMSDKSANWGPQDGLKALIPSLLLLNMVGYSFVIPDMIGGSQNFPTKQLYIRWLQASTFMPVMQFSFAPWDFDEETVEISKKFTHLHYLYSNKIIELVKKKTLDGTPVNLPIWWLDPSDEEALATDSEFLLGTDILVAPILVENATRRDIYFPKGQWQEKLQPFSIISGPTWIRDYQVPLQELAYFERINS